MLSTTAGFNVIATTTDLDEQDEDESRRHFGEIAGLSYSISMRLLDARSSIILAVCILLFNLRPMALNYLFIDIYMYINHYNKLFNVFYNLLE